MNYTPEEIYIRLIEISRDLSIIRNDLSKIKKDIHSMKNATPKPEGMMRIPVNNTKKEPDF